MAVTVKTNTNTGISVAQGAGATGSITVTKSTGGKLQSLADVNTTDLQDGYTIIYDTTTNKWVSQPISAGAVSVTGVDGGTY
tara:strand:- start:1364 stop:1609 length:246 start_codon:yes stop_codon:yes gene_type:complete